MTAAAFYGYEFVEKQLHAMETSRFDIVVREPGPEGRYISKQEGLLVEQVKDLAQWMHEFNQKGNNILIRPHGEHGLTLLNNLTGENLGRMERFGFNPALVVEYLPGHYHAWLKHAAKFSVDQHEYFIHTVCDVIDVNASENHWNSYGYLAGYHYYRDAEDPQPYEVALIEWGGSIYEHAEMVARSYNLIP